MNRRNWTHWVRWCNSDQPIESIDSLVMALIELTQCSKYPNPIVTAFIEEEEFLAAGYLILYPGELGSLGNMRFQSRKESTADAIGELAMVALAQIAKTLFQSAMEQGAEIVQAISPLLPGESSLASRSPFTPYDLARETALEAAGMRPVAKLVQMERNCYESLNAPSVEIPHPLKREGQLEYLAHDSISESRWHELIEQTYVDTLDVPELNGLRQTKSTLEGYASTLRGTSKPWWAIRSMGLPIGCLLLTPMDEETCELTYIGLIPTSRGKGISKSIMEFVSRWSERQGVRRMTLAVDVRNTPAIRLYQSCSYSATRFVQAWIYSETKVAGKTLYALGASRD
jgi:ribosomal protein S18 acetylase RimI-like enzyme